MLGWLFRRARKSSRAGIKTRTQNTADHSDHQRIESKTAPKDIRWRDTLTYSMRENCDAPSEETVLHAYDLYCEALDAPFQARRDRMRALFTQISASITTLQAGAPGVVERALARNPIEHNPPLYDKGSG